MSDPSDPNDSNHPTAVSSNQTNLLVVGQRPLCFTVSHYNDYKSYAWSRFYRNKDYGEIGLSDFAYNGDPQSVTAMDKGFIYIYKMEGSSAYVWKAFSIDSGQYQEVKVNSGQVDYATKIGPARDHARVNNYFPSAFHDVPERIFIVDSHIKLSQKRLSDEVFSISENVRDRSYSFQLSYSRMQDAQDNPLSGPTILNNYRTGQGDAPDGITYDLKLETFGQYKGFNLRRADAFEEGARRARIYRSRLQRYQLWLNDEDRNKKAYIHQTLVAILRKDSDRISNLNENRFRQWADDDAEEYKEKFFPVHYATESLLEWLSAPIFAQWLLDYNHSEDDDVQENGLKAYIESIIDLSLIPKGREYLLKVFEDDRSFFNMATHIPEIRRNYTDPDAHSNFAVEVRKVSNVIFAGLQEFAGFIARDANAASKISEWAQSRGVTLQTKQSKAAKFTGRLVSHIDIEHLETAARSSSKFVDSVHGRSIVSCFELVNLGIAIYGVDQAIRAEGNSSYGTDVFFSVLNASGAISDFAAAGLLEKHTKRLLVKAGRLNFLIMFSGVVDMVVGFRAGYKEIQTHDYDAAFGWAVFAVGGAIVAAGGYLQYTGGAIAIGSGGTASIPGGVLILAGFIVEAIGLLWVWLANDDELDDWMKACMFGEAPSYGNLDRDLAALNNLMCKFEVDATFHSDTHVEIELIPRLCTEDSVFELTRLHTDAEMTWSEIFDWNSDSDDLVTGHAGFGSRTIEISNPSPATIHRSGNRISKVSISLHGRQDIDGVRGDARLKVGPGGYIHGYSTSFNVEK
ncbi:hypothetical protein TDB9533_00875 [Thalassocella blandensis]|nr:hypothetical protein TDB9533_00875 [Thalassocella blandensis]